MSDTTLYNILCVVLMVLVVGFALAYAVRLLQRTRPEFEVGRAIAAGFVLRLVAIATVSISGTGLMLRGGDENTFLADARRIAASNFDSDLRIPAQFHRLHEIVFALQMKFGDFPDNAMRVTQVGFALLGIILILAAIYDLAGPRAAHIAAWVFALEPASLLYNGILHREPMLVLASGLVILGGSKVWTKLEWRGVLMIALGCLIAVAIRPYAGWFLMAGGLLLILHAAIRQVGSTLRALPLIYAGVVAIALAMPWVLNLTSDEKLEGTLQVSQNANTNLYTARSGAVGLNNLALERVDFSSRTGLVTNLPIRVRDILLKPYPWQLQNTAQRLGAIGTMVALAALFLLLRYLRRNRGRIMTVAAPVIYPAIFLTVAYALSVGNAGTGFRYRTHLVVLGLATLVILREHAKRDEAAADEELPVAESAAPEPKPLAVSAALR
jgi:hypothetical protein